MRFPREMRRTCERERGREGERMAHTRRQRSLHTGVIHTVSIGVFAPYDNSLRNADRSASTKYTITVCSRYERIVVVGKEKKIGGVFRLFAAFNSAHFPLPPPSLSFSLSSSTLVPPLYLSSCILAVHLYIYMHIYIYIYIYCPIERRAKARPSSRKSVPSPRRRRRRRRPKGSSTTEILA